MGYVVHDDELKALVSLIGKEVSTSGYCISQDENGVAHNCMMPQYNGVLKSIKYQSLRGILKSITLEVAGKLEEISMDTESEGTTWDVHRGIFAGNKQIVEIPPVPAKQVNLKSI